MSTDLARLVGADLNRLAHQLRLGVHGDNFLLQGFQLSRRGFFTIAQNTL